MVECIVIISNPLGIHARPAALIVKRAAEFDCDISLSKGSVSGINGKSIMGVMMLAAEQGAEVKIVGEGPDAEEAVAAVAELMQSNFEDAV